MDLGATGGHPQRREHHLRRVLGVVSTGAIVALAAACSPSDEVAPIPSSTTTVTVATETTVTTLVPVVTTTTEASVTTVPPMLVGVGTHNVEPFFTVGEAIGSYSPIGALDGLGAYPVGTETVRLLANHEVQADEGATYELANGLELVGARIDFFDISVQSRGVTDAGLAYEAIYDRTGAEVTTAAQINETGHEINGLDRLCSAQLIEAGTHGFIDSLFLTGEESKITDHPHGGSVWSLDVEGRALWALPELGRGVWENLTPLETGNPDTIALLMGDDKGPAPLYLWVGQLHPEATGRDNFVLRNGLSDGTLFVWVSDVPDAVDYDDFSGTGSTMAGHFVSIEASDPSKAGEEGHDAAGYKDEDTLKSEAFDDLGAFQFARPEDVATNPLKGAQAVFAVTGSDEASDLWGGVYVVDVSDFESSAPEGLISILLDGNETADESVRNPDNLDWADDGFIYVQEDKANDVFGLSSGRDASVYQIDPATGLVETLAEIDRAVISPSGADNVEKNTLGAWESSGILDVSALFPTSDAGTLLVATVQAHSTRLGEIESRGLVQGGQLVWITVGQ